jgi:hypothetical protein
MVDAGHADALPTRTAAPGSGRGRAYRWMDRSPAATRPRHRRAVSGKTQTGPGGGPAEASHSGIGGSAFHQPGRMPGLVTWTTAGNRHPRWCAERSQGRSAPPAHPVTLFRILSSLKVCRDGVAVPGTVAWVRERPRPPYSATGTPPRIPQVMIGWREPANLARPGKAHPFGRGRETAANLARVRRRSLAVRPSGGQQYGSRQMLPPSVAPQLGSHDPVS